MNTKSKDTFAFNHETSNREVTDQFTVNRDGLNKEIERADFAENAGVQNNNHSTTNASGNPAWEIAPLSYSEMLEQEEEEADIEDLSESIGKVRIESIDDIEISNSQPEAEEALAANVVEETPFIDEEVSSSLEGSLPSQGFQSLEVETPDLPAATPSPELELSPQESTSSFFGLKAKQSKNQTESASPLDSQRQEVAPGKQLDMEGFLASNVSVDRSEEKLSLLGVEQNLTALAELVANLTESYTSSIFLLDQEKEELVLAGAHTLSRDFIEDARIPFGCGLIAWAAESKLPTSSYPFERDAKTLQIYSKDQGLKCFIAVPIKDHTEQVLGVIACDSKKSYSFTKATEKLISECARQAATLIELHQRIDNLPNTLRVNFSDLDQTLETLRACKKEEDLMEKAAHLPRDIIDYESIVIVSSSANGIGDGRYFSSTNNQTEHRLLELVCKQKKIICSDRSVHALPTDDLKQRSFLSIPFKSLDREAGSINLLSQPQQGFDASEISAAEKIAAVLGAELERIRLRQFAKWKTEPAGFFRWEDFRLIANSQIKKTYENNQSLSLARISFNNLGNVEIKAGSTGTLETLKKIERLLEQIKKDHNPATKIHSSSFLVLMESSEVDNFIHRFCNQIERLEFSSLENSIVCEDERLGDLLLKEMSFTITKTPGDGETLTELNRKALKLLIENQRHVSGN